MKGVGAVTICVDKDEEGWNHARQVLASLRRVLPATVRIATVEAREGHDVKDHLDAGLSLDELLPVDLGDSAPPRSGSYEPLSKEDRLARAEAIKESVFAVDDAGNKLRLKRLSDIEESRVDWLWHEVIVRGAPTMWEGDPDSGKTFSWCDVVARVTTGRRMPDGTVACTPSNVIIVAPEDSLAKTLKPRLRAAGADMDRISTVELRRDEDEHLIPLFLDESLNEIADLIQESNTALIVFDPITGIISEKISTHASASVRRMLTPLGGVLDDLNVAALMVRHLNQSGDLKAIYRGTGSNAFLEVARAGLAVAFDPDSDPYDPQRRRCLVQTKGNLTKKKLALGFHIEDDPETGIGRVVWHEGALNLDADTLLRGPDARRDAPKLEEAEEVLFTLLSNGPMRVSGPTGIEAETEKAGVTWGTVKRAAASLKVVKTRHWKKGGGVDYVTWELPVTEESNVIPFNLPGSSDS